MKVKTMPRQSSAKAQRIKAINERNVELCQEILELGKLRGLIQDLKKEVESEKDMTRCAEITAKTEMVIPTAAFQKMMSEIDKFSGLFEDDIIDEDDYAWFNVEATSPFENVHVHDVVSDGEELLKLEEE